MMRRAVLIATLIGLGHFSFIQAQEHWVATWTTAETLAEASTPQAQPPAGPPTPQSINRFGFHNQTVRMIVRTSIPGRRVRIALSNAFGAEPVVIGAAHIAVQEKGSEIAPGTDRALAFNGKPGCTIRPGAVMLSDAVDLAIPQTGHLAVSLYFPEATGMPTIHSTALHNTYVSTEGDTTAKPSMPDAVVTESYYYLDGVDVLAPADAGLIVAFGDSITDGARSENETDHSWPALLAVRLAKNKKTAHIAVGNMGIGGNRVLRDGAGISALARLDRDVISQPGVKWLMVLEAINDIGRGGTDPREPASAEELIAAHQQIIDRAHMHGIKVIGCTLTPYEGAGYSRESGEVIREAVNQWIRTSGAYDAVVDFEAAVRDPQNPKRFRADFDPGDHLHPNNAGYQAMADAIDLQIFEK
jgi:lysophospholipase L1-like esterase